MDLTFTDKNPSLFYDLSDFPSLKILEDNHDIILEELLSLRAGQVNGYWLETFPAYVSSFTSRKWEVFTFQFFGIKHSLNIRSCPKTSEILFSIPELVSADFSFLPAKTKINPHCGFTKMVLRSHLGLVIPEDCGLRVGNEHRNWQKGKVLIFDDSFEHEAWNNSLDDRFVLMLDIANPKWNYTANEICRYKIENLSDEFMLSMFPKEKWMEFLNKGFFDLPFAL
ncbi:MAG: aspartyl/asparaginyl beta-hydroxylase domain-containing protein [Bacteroidota bacterium]|jgi:aspartyl/asparaginyl beta-hydroxylase (cupin superfamily)